MKGRVRHFEGWFNFWIVQSSGGGQSARIEVEVDGSSDVRVSESQAHCIARITVA